MKKYLEFLTESKLELLLEANMFYTQNFSNILDNIDHPISDEIKKLRGKEVDVNTNLIDLDFTKDDYILFIPDSKVEKMDYVTDEYIYSNISLTDKLKETGEYTIIDKLGTPNNELVVKIVKNFSIDELNELLPGVNVTKLYSLVEWTTVYGTTYHCLYETDYLRRDTEDIKPSPYKIGRFVNNLLTKAGVEFLPKDIEAFVDKFKSEMKKKRDVFDSLFDIVSGEDLRNFYLDENYFYDEQGSLGGSCMKNSYCQNYLDIYVENDDVCSLVILRSEEDNDMIVGRALLWDAIQKSTDKRIKFMDRIYTAKSNDIELFRQYAIKNGFYYKWKQDYSEVPLMFNGKEISNEDSYIIVVITSGGYNYYPYIDTVKYHNVARGILSNSSSNGQIRNSTDGGCDHCSNTGSVQCYNCEGDGRYECDECGGSRYEECSSCEGSGKEDCNRCSGYGEQECTNCDGRGNVDDEEGDEIECPDCDGNGRIECSKCDGDGNEDCYNCDGKGRNDCSYCDGDGDRECYNCEGDGNEDCPECQ